LINGHLACICTATLKVAILRRYQDIGIELLIDNAHMKVRRTYIHFTLGSVACIDVGDKSLQVSGLCWVALPVSTDNRFAWHGVEKRR
jgi:hypothetical protein